MIWTVLGQQGGTFQCFTPSGFVSMPTSQRGAPTYCSGRTPGYWKQQQFFSSWLPPYYPITSGGNSASLFSAYFQPLPGTCPVGTDWSTVTFLQVLSPELYTRTTNSGAPFDIARLLIASLLNVAQGWVSVLTAPLVQDIWTEYMTKGYFEPTAGVKWYHDDIVSYLGSTQPV